MGGAINLFPKRNASLSELTGQQMDSVAER
jgi:hypothetical protein